MSDRGQSGISSRLDRRAAIAGLSAAVISTGLVGVGPGRAQDGSALPARRFSFDLLTEEMRDLAGRPPAAAAPLAGILGDLTYADYRRIRFRPDRARWSDSGSEFHVHAFHTGWLFGEPVRLFEVSDGEAREMRFTARDFVYPDAIARRLPDDFAMPGVAGFRLHCQLNRPDVFDELVAFLGASYFRGLGRGSAYGLSARGLALDTGSDRPEEFPRFTQFYLERPAPGAAEIVVWGALESPSVTGAYRFAIRPGGTTEMDVTARLFFRAAVAQLGVAPLTSMYFFSSANRATVDDYRPAVHDSDGLRIERGDGDRLWRPLNNPPQVSNSSFAEVSPRAFGLHQSRRDFESFEDPGAHYERRPSLRVEPLEDWGRGQVRLVEIPTDIEANDNIVAFWTPEGGVRGGDERAYSYRLHWGDLPHQPGEPLAWVDATRTGGGGVSGVPVAPGTRKFVVDFRGGMLASLPTDADVAAVTTVSGGEIVTSTLDRLNANGLWRLAIDVAAPQGGIVELGAHLAGYDRKLSETWLCQWIAP